MNFCGGSSNSDEQGVNNYKLGKEWTHVTGVHQNRSVIFYINGKYFGKDEFAASPNQNDNDLVIGSMPSNQGYFNGILDEVYIFTRAISDDEVARIYEGNYK